MNKKQKTIEKELGKKYILINISNFFININIIK